jgi:hypothetical protein
MDARWPKHEFISRDSHHITSRFCRVELGLTQNSMMVVLEPIEDQLGHLLSGFYYC